MGRYVGGNSREILGERAIRGKGSSLLFSTLKEIIAAVHLAPYVSGPTSERGGLMLCSPSGSLKTSAADVLDSFDKTLVCSDVTVRSLTAMRDDFLSSRIRTLVFADYAKLHKRHSSVSSNIEGIIMALAGEGFCEPAYSDQRIQAVPARATIVGCMTTKFFDKMKTEWIDGGFYRRFLWARYTMNNPEVLENAYTEWRKALIDGDFAIKVPQGKTIKHFLTHAEAAKVRRQIYGTVDKSIQFVLAQKVVSILRWKFGEKEGWEIWQDFAPALSKSGTELILTDKFPKAMDR